MKKYIYKGFSITTFDSYYGLDLIIEKAGAKVYSARIHKNQLVSMVKQVLG